MARKKKKTAKKPYGVPLGETGQKMTRVNGPLYLDVYNRLPPELRWMAYGTAAALQETATALKKKGMPPIDPVLVRRRRQYDQLERKMSAEYPAWRKAEDRMSELHDFLCSRALTHKKFGSKLRLLYLMAKHAP